MLDLVEKALTLQRICEKGNHRHEDSILSHPNNYL